MSGSWCLHCCTLHDGSAKCPGELPATGPERHGWRVDVDTPSGPQAFGVLVAESYDLWRARIVTYPNILWKVPGGRKTLKFAARSPSEAERQAIDFIEEHCAARRYRRREEISPVQESAVAVESADSNGRPDDPKKRKLRCLPVRFGAERPDVVGMTMNLSREGMFIGTALPLDAGEPVRIHVALQGEPIVLRGVVMWNRKRREPGRPAGMGVRLVDPPPIYPNFVQQLP